MAKEALIKLRCSTALKEKLTALAKANEQNLSDYIRTKLLEHIPELRSAIALNLAPGEMIAKTEVLERFHEQDLVKDLPPHDTEKPA